MVQAASTVAQLPPDGPLPEVVFAGRSNVGKSSLLNAVLGRRDFVKTSKTPGATQSVNFFRVGAQLLCVDVPGYGFAAAPGDVSRRWSRTVVAYFKQRKALRRVYVLIDARRGVMPVDQDFMDLLDSYEHPYRMVVTKMDTLRAAEEQDAVARVRAFMSLQRHVVPAAPLPVSAVSLAGIDELRLDIVRATELKPPKAYRNKYTPPPPVASMRPAPRSTARDDASIDAMLLAADAPVSTESRGGTDAAGSASAAFGEADSRDAPDGTTGDDGGGESRDVGAWRLFVRSPTRKHRTAAVQTLDPEVLAQLQQKQ